MQLEIIAQRLTNYSAQGGKWRKNYCLFLNRMKAEVTHPSSAMSWGKSRWRTCSFLRNKLIMPVKTQCILVT